MILKRPILPVISVCVPPQSSLLKSPSETTLTRSPYFSSKRAVASVLNASSASISSIWTGIFSLIFWFTMVSISFRVSRSVREKWVKSKRNLSGATSDTACFTWSPRTLRRAKWSRWVAVWLSSVASRFALSTVRFKVSPFLILPDLTLPLWMIRPVGSLIVSVTTSSRFSPVILPVSPACPPASP